MTSRNGLHFNRWPDALIPEDAPEDRSGNRSNYMTRALLKLPGNDRELSVYATEAYYTGPDSRVRRFTYRVDGFVSAHASSERGRLLTRPMVFSGDRLEVNYATSPTGSVRIEVQDLEGKPIPGLALDDCSASSGDSIAHVVRWNSDAEVSAITGQPIRLLFELRDADVYSFPFRQ